MLYWSIISNMSSWQDLVLLIAQIIFIIALFPSILSKDKPAITTSIMNAVVLFIISFVNFTLNLFGALFGLFLVAVCWTILAVQKYLVDKNK